MISAAPAVTATQTDWVVMLAVTLVVVIGIIAYSIHKYTKDESHD